LSIGHPEFDAFLSAPVGEDADSVELSVMSALASIPGAKPPGCRACRTTRRSRRWPRPWDRFRPEAGSRQATGHRGTAAATGEDGVGRALG